VTSTVEEVDREEVTRFELSTVRGDGVDLGARIGALQ
jgi:hypothetical protein